MLRSALLIAAVALSASAAPAQQTFDLRYRFQPGETLEFEVVQQANIETTVQGETGEATVRNQSQRRWVVQEVDAEGVATIVVSTLKVQMRSTDGGASVEFDSGDPAKQPVQYRHVLELIGKPLAEVKISAQGKVLGEKLLVESEGIPKAPVGQVLPILADRPVKIGESWKHDFELIGRGKKIPARQTFTFTAIKDGQAVVEYKTVLLAPVNDPLAESELVWHRPSGTVLYDFQRGLVTSQDAKLDATVVGFQGPASSLKVQSLATERLLPSTVARNATGGATR